MKLTKILERDENGRIIRASTTSTLSLEERKAAKAAFSRKSYEKHMERAKKRARKHHKNNREHHRDLTLQRNYGITLEEYNRLLEKQAHVCAICGKPPSGKGRAGKVLHVDHDHTTGVVRGLLCNKCNFLLGQAKDNSEILEKARRYLIGSSDTKYVRAAECEQVQAKVPDLWALGNREDVVLRDGT